MGWQKHRIGLGKAWLVSDRPHQHIHLFLEDPAVCSAHAHPVFSRITWLAGATLAMIGDADEGMASLLEAIILIHVRPGCLRRVGLPTEDHLRNIPTALH